jgi:hypothetical protein
VGKTKIELFQVPVLKFFYIPTGHRGVIGTGARYQLESLTILFLTGLVCIMLGRKAGPG